MSQDLSIGKDYGIANSDYEFVQPVQAESPNGQVRWIEGSEISDDIPSNAAAAYVPPLSEAALLTNHHQSTIESYKNRIKAVPFYDETTNNSEFFWKISLPPKKRGMLQKTNSNDSYLYGGTNRTKTNETTTTTSIAKTDAIRPLQAANSDLEMKRRKYGMDGVPFYAETTNRSTYTPKNYVQQQLRGNGKQKRSHSLNANNFAGQGSLAVIRSENRDVEEEHFPSNQQRGYRRPIRYRAKDNLTTAELFGSFPSVQKGLLEQNIRRRSLPLKTPENKSVAEVQQQQQQQQQHQKNEQNSRCPAEEAFRFKQISHLCTVKGLSRMSAKSRQKQIDVKVTAAAGRQLIGAPYREESGASSSWKADGLVVNTSLQWDPESHDTSVTLSWMSAKSRQKQIDVKVTAAAGRQLIGAPYREESGASSPWKVDSLVGSRRR